MALHNCALGIMLVPKIALSLDDLISQGELTTLNKPGIWMFTVIIIANGNSYKKTERQKKYWTSLVIGWSLS